MADKSSHCPVFFALSESSKHVKSIHLEPMASFFPKICLSPGIEELGLHLLVGIKSNEVLILIVFMYEIHGMSIPFSETTSLSLRSVFLHDLYEFCDSFFEILHIFGTEFDFLDSVLGSHI